MPAPEKRLNAYRPDLADIRLSGKVAAERFVEGVVHHIRAPLAAVRQRPSPDAPLDTEALMGETVLVFESDEGWCWGQLARDGYVGYLPQESLAPGPGAPTHRVAALRSFLYPGPSIKLPPLAALSFGAEPTVLRMEKDFAVTADGFVFAAHLAPLHEHAIDFVAEAERFIGTPYLWGGKSSLGLDCSGLVALALAAAGIHAPRDSDMQEETVGNALALDHTFSGLKRGDLIFWDGHVGIMRDAQTLLHANGHSMDVANEPLVTANERIRAKTGAGMTTIRRLAV